MQSLKFAVFSRFVANSDDTELVNRSHKYLNRQSKFSLTDRAA